MRWIIFLFFFVGLSEGVNVTQKDVIGELNSVWLQWQACPNKQRCDLQRNHTCTQNTSPHVACNGIVWKQELKGCHQCASNAWFPTSGWSSCSGKGCTDTVQSKRFSCTAATLQPNCVKTEIQFCAPKVVCDGTWTPWFATPCPVSCNGGIRLRSRRCEKNKISSSNCAKTYSNFVDTNLEPCNTKSCAEQPVWGNWGKCDCSKTNDHQRRQCSSNCPGTLPIFQYRNCVQCSTTQATSTKGSTTTTKSTTTTTLSTTTPSTSTTAIQKQEKGTADSRNAVHITGGSTTTTVESNFNGQPASGAGSDRVVIIVTATVIVAFLVFIICVLVLRMRRKTKPLQIQVQQQANPPTADNRRSLLLEAATDGVYEEMTLGGSCPNFKRPLPATPSSLRHPPKPPRRNRPLSEVSVHSFPDLQRSLSANDAGDQSLSAGPSPTGSFRVHQIYSNPHSGKYLKPMN